MYHYYSQGIMFVKSVEKRANKARERERLNNENNRVYYYGFKIPST